MLQLSKPRPILVKFCGQHLMLSALLSQRVPKLVVGIYLYKQVSTYLLSLHPKSDCRVLKLPHHLQILLGQPPQAEQLVVGGLFLLHNLEDLPALFLQDLNSLVHLSLLQFHFLQLRNKLLTDYPTFLQLNILHRNYIQLVQNSPR